MTFPGFPVPHFCHAPLFPSSWIKQDTNEEMDLGNRRIKLPPVKPDWIVLLLARLPSWSSRFPSLSPGSRADPIQCLWWVVQAGRARKCLSPSFRSEIKSSWSLLMKVFCPLFSSLDWPGCPISPVITSYLCYCDSLWTDRRGSFTVRCIWFDLGSTTYLQVNPWAMSGSLTSGSLST